MRKIARQAAEAFLAGKPFSSGNTKVAITIPISGLATNIWVMRLHGNIIATYNGYNHSFQTTLAGWATPTTYSRLNVLLTLARERPEWRQYVDSVGLYHTVKRRPHYDDVEISSRAIIFHCPERVMVQDNTADRVSKSLEQLRVKQKAPKVKRVPKQPELSYCAALIAAGV